MHFVMQNLGSSMTMLSVSPYMGVVVDAMERVSGIVDYSFGEEGFGLPWFEDELDIIGEVAIDDNAEEEHVRSPSTYVVVDPSVECMSSQDWIG